MIIFINAQIGYPSNPPIFVGSVPSNANSYASVSELTNLQIQLFIDDTMSKEEFDARIAGNPNYPTIVHLQNLRILVIMHSFYDGYGYHGCYDGYEYRGGYDDHACNYNGTYDYNSDHNHDYDDNFYDGYNHQHADVVLFLHQGLADIEHNRFGPPRQNFPTQRLTIYELFNSVHQHNVVVVPWGVGGNCCECCQYPFYCDCCHTFSGIRKCGGCGGESKCGCSCGLYDRQGIKSSPVHLPSCDNEAHNPAFIYRK